MLSSRDVLLLGCSPLTIV
ncbi:hypothetical protein A2U01_0118931, partial [Trifolium medium]|nr:hypothetical protein [Trifolium medium]